MQTNLNLSEKYRPTSLEDLVIPTSHSLHPLFSFLEEPYSASWLFTGKSGVGKTSLGEIMAAFLTNRHHVTRLVGSDLDHNHAKEIEMTLLHDPLFGAFHFILVNEADCITAGGQVRLLSLLERRHRAIWVFTSNESTSSFEPRFLSRVRHVHFSTQGMLGPATQWLVDLAKKEGLRISPAAAARIIRRAKNNLRNALQELELLVLKERGSAG